MVLPEYGVNGGTKLQENNLWVEQKNYEVGYMAPT